MARTKKIAQSAPSSRNNRASSDSLPPVENILRPKSRKRNNDLVSSSEGESEVTMRSPKKGRLATPGTPEYEDMPAVSSKRASALGSVSKRLKFGTTDISEVEGSSKSPVKPPSALDKKKVAAPPSDVKRGERSAQSQNPIEDAVTVKLEPGVKSNIADAKAPTLTARRGQKRARSQTPREEAGNMSNSVDSTSTPSRPQRLKKLTEKGAYNSTSSSRPADIVAVDIAPEKETSRAANASKTQGSLPLTSSSGSEDDTGNRPRDLRKNKVHSRRKGKREPSVLTEDMSDPVESRKSKGREKKKERVQEQSPYSEEENEQRRESGKTRPYVGRQRKSKYASPRPRRRESSVISISSDSELEEVKRPSRHVVERSKARGVALKKSKSSARLIYEENSDDRDFIDDSALVDDESDEGSQQGKPARKRARKGKTIGDGPTAHNEDRQATPEKNSEGLRKDKGVVKDGTVLNESLQDEALKDVYKSLKPLPYVYMAPHSSKDAVDADSYIRYSLIAPDLYGVQKESLDAALAFETYGCFLNPARASLSFVRAKDSRLVTSDTGENAVFLITGCIGETYLRTPYSSGYDSDKRVYHLRLVPLSQEFQLVVAYLGNAFGVRDLAGPVSGPTFALSTRKEGASSGSPKKYSGTHLSKYSSPSKGRSSSKINMDNYPSFLDFDQPVPIFDATQKGFRFDEDSFDRLNDLPLWGGGKRDLVDNSVVTVGFAAGSFEPTVGQHANGRSLALMPNILFVIVLGLLA